MAESIDGPSNMSDEDPTKLCDPCKFRGIHKQAGTHCPECSEYLCDLCEEIHRSMKLSRNHELKPIDDQEKISFKQRNLISATMTCEDHRSEVLSLLCQDHNEPACLQCKLTKHRKCTTRTLKEAAKEAKSQQDVSHFAENLKSLTAKLNDIKESREKGQKTLQSCSEKLIIEIQQFKHDIIAWASKLEKDMLDEVKSTTEKLLADVDEDARTVGVMVNQLEEVTNSLDILGLDVPATSLVIALKEQRKLDEAGEIMNDILKAVKPVKMSFNPSSSLVAAMADITLMGTLNTDMKDESNICFQEITSVSKKETINVGTSGVTGWVKPVKMSFNPSSSLVAAMSDITSMGTLNTDMKDESNICFQKITSVSKKETINVGTNFVTGCVFTPDGELVVCGGNFTVKVLTRDIKLRHEINPDSFTWDVAVVSQDEVIVTQPYSKRLQVLNVSGEIKKAKSFSVNMKCYGVDCKNDMIYVSCRSQTENGGEIKVLTMTGETLNTFKINHVKPCYLAVNGLGDRIIIGTGRSLALCTDMTGKVLYTYTDSELIRSGGVMFDNHDNVLVCGCDPHNIHVVNRDGTKHRIILTSDDGLSYTRCIAYRACDRTLVVGKAAVGGENSLLAFTVNK